MLKKVVDFFQADAVADTGTSKSADDLQIAAAALLIEAARLDEDEHPDEMRAVRRLLQERFDLGDEETDHVIELASERQERSVELHSFTHVIKTRFSHDERVQLIEMLWEVVYADGRLHDFEANLMRRIGGLIHVSDRERGEARKRALQRLQSSGATPGGT